MDNYKMQYYITVIFKCNIILQVFIRMWTLDMSQHWTCHQMSLIIQHWHY